MKKLLTAAILLTTLMINTQSAQAGFMAGTLGYATPIEEEDTSSFVWADEKKPDTAEKASIFAEQYQDKDFNLIEYLMSCLE